MPRTCLSLRTFSEWSRFTCFRRVTRGRRRSAVGRTRSRVPLCPLHLLSDPLPKRDVPFRGSHDAIAASSMPEGVGNVAGVVVITGGVVSSATGVVLMTMLSRRAVEKDEIRIGSYRYPT